MFIKELNLQTKILEGAEAAPYKSTLTAEEWEARQLEDAAACEVKRTEVLIERGRQKRALWEAELAKTHPTGLDAQQAQQRRKLSEFSQLLAEYDKGVM